MAGVNRLAIALWLVAAVCRLAAGEREAYLKELVDTEQWFELRDATEAAATPPFYRGVVSCVFDDVRRAEKLFQSVFKSVPGSSESFGAHGLLASGYARAGRYRQALGHLEAMQASKPDYEGVSGAVALFRALSGCPQPAVARRRFSELRMSEMFIPVIVNGKQANYGFDTGADFSLMSEAEARRLDLQIHEVAGSELRDNASGNKVSIRFAMANRLMVGGFDLRNVAFLVLKNDVVPFVEQPADRQGILGFPVVRAFGTMRWDSDGVCQIGFRSDAKGRKPNLCIPVQSQPVIDGRFGPNRIHVAFDTGAGRTRLTPRFAKDFPGVIEQAGKKELTSLRGVGGRTEVEAITLPEFKFRAGDFDLVLRPAQVLPPDSRVDRNGYHVWLGTDLLLEQARCVTLDFEAMRFTLE